MARKKKKFYVVWEGVETGIFKTWAECKANIHGYPQAKYKSFFTLETAEKAYSESYYSYAGKDIQEKFVPELSKEELLLIGEPISNSISVDAACSGNPGKLEYKGVNTKTGEIIFKMGPFEEGTINIGEFLAIVHGIAELQKNNDTRAIYSDSSVAISWVKKKWTNTSLKKNEKNEKLFGLFDRALNWLKNNDYQNEILKWETKAWGENPADFGRK